MATTFEKEIAFLLDSSTNLNKLSQFFAFAFEIALF